MPLVPLRVVLDHAAENDYGVAAFNVNNMEQIQAIMEASDETDSPAYLRYSGPFAPTAYTASFQRYPNGGCLSPGAGDGPR